MDYISFFKFSSVQFLHTWHEEFCTCNSFENVSFVELPSYNFWRHSIIQVVLKSLETELQKSNSCPLDRHTIYKGHMH